METKLFGTTKYELEQAAKIIANGGLVAFPTETVYGLGANALNDTAVKNIYKAKGRPSDNPLIVHIANKEDIVPLVKEITPKAKALMDAFFPAPLTIILKKSSKIGNTVSGGLDTVAVRMPKNKIARQLIELAGCPVAAPSANTSGLPSPTRYKYVVDDMMGKIDGIIDGGDCEYGVESTVITFATSTPMILRPGAITKEMIENIIGKVDVSSAVLEGMKDGEVAASPGMKYKHYAPQAKVIMVKGSKEQYENFVNVQKNAFALCFDQDKITIPKVTFGKENDDLSQAKELFDALRLLDEKGAKKVYARVPNTNGVGMAVYNRLIRAAAFQIIDLTKPFTIGLTGPTGAGKGYICEKLKQKGFKIIECDYYAREVVKSQALLDKLIKAFGDDIIKNNNLDRKALAEKAFASKDKTKILNDIMHPAIIELCKAQAEGLTVLDAPQLFEAKAENECYKIISVIADEDVRIKRILARDNITEIEAKKRISAQFNNQYYMDHSDYVIYNNGENIDNQIDNILEVIL